MDTVKAVLVLFLGGYILMGEGPRWIGGGDEGPAIDVSMMDGMQTMEDPGERERPRSAAIEGGFVPSAAASKNFGCSNRFEAFAAGAEGALHLAARTPDTPRPGPVSPPAASSSKKGPPAAPAIEGCAPHSVAPAGAPRAPGH